MEDDLNKTNGRQPKKKWKTPSKKIKMEDDPKQKNGKQQNKNGRRPKKKKKEKKGKTFLNSSLI
jgi:hypothetical protein